MTFTQSRWLPVVLLTCSNVFMTFAWYGNLNPKFKSSPLWLVILASWGIAFFEYVFMIPANRWGNSVYSVTQLKIIQEVITLTVFCGFAALYLGEKIRWNHLAAFVCILAAVAFHVFAEGLKTTKTPSYKGWKGRFHFVALLLCGEMKLS